MLDCHHQATRQRTLRRIIRSLRLWLIASGAVALLCLLLTGCGATQHDSSRTADTPTSDIAAYIVSADFPVDAGDWAAGQQLGAFELSIQDKAIDSCMAGDGLPAPPPIMNEFTANNIEFPDLSAIARQGFTSPAIPNPPDPTHGMSAAERAAYRVAEQRCAGWAVRPFLPLNESARALKYEWADVLGKIDASPQVQQALARFSSCTAAAGDPSKTVQDFLGIVDDRTVPLFERRENARAEAVEHQLGQVFDRCIGPLQKLRTKLRAQQRAVFFASHAQAINSLRAKADTVVVNLERKYGLGIPHTVPVQP